MGLRDDLTSDIRYVFAILDQGLFLMCPRIHIYKEIAAT